MLRIDFVTLFPEMVLSALDHSILKRAQDSGAVRIGAVDPREFTKDRHRTVDERPFDGGPGMVMMAPPIAEALESLDLDADAAVILLDARGPLFNQAAAAELSKKARIVFVCGHYGGVDDRVRTLFATHVYSVGDYVLTGGELPALVIADAVVRLLPEVLGSEESAEQDSHADGLLSAPQFTQPVEFKGLEVPDLLRSGDHVAASRWKRAESLKATRRLRPDLFWRADLEKADVDMLSF